MVTTALLIFFWAVVPGLITGWMLRERGRSFLPGLLLGAIFGPLGILGVLTFIYVADRRREHGRVHAVRVFYEIPVVGRLHVSTVWALAGVATFLCLWMIGGITYEVYRAELKTAATPEQARQTAGQPAQPNSLLPTNPTSERQPAETRTAEPTQGSPGTQARSALLGNFSGQPGQPPAQPQPPGNSATNWQPAPGPPAVTAAPPAPGAPAAAATTPQPTNAPPAPQPPRPPAAASRSEAVAEVTRDLASRGHRVHAAVSGDPQTATLSLSGGTLTREAGNQLLGNGRLRGALKSAGVRIVVVMNGEQSWTYML